MKLGIIGIGYMGGRLAAALARMGDVCEFVAAADLREEAVREAADLHKVVAFTDPAELLERVEAVVIATPPSSHRELGVAAAQAGKHLFIEKPLAATMEDCDAIIAAAEEAGVVAMTGQVLRFYPVHELGWQLVAEGVIGDLVHLESDYALPYCGQRERPATWFGSIGGLLENGIHKVDLLNWFGGEALHVAAERGSFSGYEDWEDYALALIRYRAGAVGVLRWGGFLGSRRSRDTFIDGTKGSLRLSIDSGLVSRKLLTEADWTEHTPADPGAEPRERELRHFVECIDKGTRCRADAREGRRAVELVLATYKSADLGSRIALPLPY